MHPIRRLIVIFLCGAVALLLAFPFALYYLGLSGIHGLPQKPRQLVSKEQQALVWKQARGDGTPHIETLNPCTYVIKLVKQDGSMTPGHAIVWQLASSYLLDHRRHKSMGWWHLSGAALTIWLTHNWTSEEILSAAAALPHDSRQDRRSSA